MVKVPGVDRLGQFHGVARAFDIDGDRAFLVCAQVVHRGEMIGMADLPLERLLRFARYTELLAGKVAKDR